MNKLKTAGKIAPEESPVNLNDPLKAAKKNISQNSPRMATLKTNLSQPEVSPDEVNNLNRT